MWKSWRTSFCSRAAETRPSTAPLQANANPAVDLVAFGRTRSGRGAYRFHPVGGNHLSSRWARWPRPRSAYSRNWRCWWASPSSNGGVYGLVGGISSARRPGPVNQPKTNSAAGLGRRLMAAAPWLMKFSRWRLAGMFWWAAASVTHGIRAAPTPSRVRRPPLTARALGGLWRTLDPTGSTERSASWLAPWCWRRHRGAETAQALGNSQPLRRRAVCPGVKEGARWSVAAGRCRGIGKRVCGRLSEALLESGSDHGAKRHHVGAPLRRASTAISLV